MHDSHGYVWKPLLNVFNSAHLKVSEVNGNGPTNLSFGSYYGPNQGQGKVQFL